MYGRGRACSGVMDRLGGTGTIRGTGAITHLGGGLGIRGAGAHGGASSGHIGGGINRWDSAVWNEHITCTWAGGRCHRLSAGEMLRNRSARFNPRTSPNRSGNRPNRWTASERRNPSCVPNASPLQGHPRPRIAMRRTGRRRLVARHHRKRPLPAALRHGLRASVEERGAAIGMRRSSNGAFAL